MIEIIPKIHACGKFLQIIIQMRLWSIGPFLHLHFAFRVDDIGRTIVSAAKEIIIKQQTKQNKEDDDVSDKIEKLQNRFDTKILELENKMGNLETKIDLILRKMTKYWCISYALLI